MSHVDFIPVLPESAPFSPEQRAYLNGFLAGLFSHAPLPEVRAAACATPPVPLTILFGSQTGNAENLAKRIAKGAAKHGYSPIVVDMAQYSLARLASDKRLLIVTSTYGDGDPPDNAKAFWTALQSDEAPKPLQNRFAVLGLGDTNYPQFCGFAKALDGRLEQLGSNRACPRCDCDVEFEQPFLEWLGNVLPALAEASSAPPIEATLPSNALDVVLPPPSVPSHSSTVYGRNNPFPAKLLVSRPLCGDRSDKDVRHIEISLESSGLSYEAGDALGVYPTNRVDGVEEILRALQCDGEQTVPNPIGEPVPLRQALTNHYDICRVSQSFLQSLAKKTGDETLQRVAAPDANGALTKFLWGRELIDLLLAYPQARFTADEFVGVLKKLQPRLYSISSSPKKHPGQVHLTVGVLKYESHGRERRGVCSNYLASASNEIGAVPVFVHSNRAFRLPPAEQPMIMIGPGTGIAPFRAFLQERAATGATGQNWLFFGDQRAACNFLYREELESMQREGVLHRLDTAFSRDQAEKVYVQHRLLENADEVFSWLENGASLYVCGDAQRMARDVDQALLHIIEKAGSRSPAEAAQFLRDLQTQKRYQRDVY